MKSHVGIFICLFITAASFGQIPELHLASDVWPPFTNFKGESSFALDLVNETLRRTGIRAETEIVPFGEVLYGIENDKYDGSAALWIDEDRKEIVLFSSPYLQNQLILVGKKGIDVQATSLKQLSDKKVAIVGSYSYGDSITNTQSITFIPGMNDQENLKKLLAGEVDYMLVDALLIQYLLMYQKEDVDKYLVIGKEPIIVRSLHFAIRKDYPHAEEIIDRFNEEIVKMVADGTYNSILHLNWVRADINGDGKVEMVLNGNNAGADAPTSGYNIYFQNSVPSSVAATNQYYIEGKLYQSWNEVPNHYKIPPINENDPSTVGIFKFSFN